MKLYIDKLHNAFLNKNNNKKNKYLKKIIMNGGKICDGTWKNKTFIGVCSDN